MKNVKLLAEILNNVQGIKRCDMEHAEPSREHSNCPLCLIGNAIRNGIDVPLETSLPTPFANFFEVTFEEADRILFPTDNASDYCKGSTYYNKGKKLFEKHGEVL